MRIGLISDTHGLLRPAVLDYLEDADHIIHAGDIGGAAILDTLGAIAPLTAVRGNNDHGDWADRLPERAALEFGGIIIQVIHDLADLRPADEPGSPHVVVCGHSHQPRVESVEHILQVNPGSAGRRRFKLPIAAGELLIANGRVEARIQTFSAD